MRMRSSWWLGRLDRLNVLKAELEGAYRSLTVHVYGADLGREDQRVAFVNWLPSQHLTIDFLINNAGLGDRGPFESGDWNRVRTILDVNISALTHLIHLLLPSMTLSGRAAILNVSSVAGFLPLPNTAVYAATKAYVTSLSESLAIELRPRGITVTALCPGPIATEFHSVSLRPGAAARESHVESMPAFVVTPEEAVRAALVAVSRRRAACDPWSAALCLDSPRDDGSVLHHAGGPAGAEKQAVNRGDHESAIDKIAGGKNAELVNKITKMSGVRPESVAFAQTLELINPHLYSVEARIRNRSRRDSR